MFDQIKKHIESDVATYTKQLQASDDPDRLLGMLMLGECIAAKQTAAAVLTLLLDMKKGDVDQKVD